MSSMAEISRSTSWRLPSSQAVAYLPVLNSTKSAPTFLAAFTWSVSGSMNRLTAMSLFFRVITYFASSSTLAATFKPPSMVISWWFSWTRVTMSGCTLVANCNISAVGEIFRFSLVVTMPRNRRTSRSWMWRLSSRRWAVMPMQPASSATSAAVTGSGSLILRASRMVAIWSMFTPSFTVMAFSLSILHKGR